MSEAGRKLIDEYFRDTGFDPAKLPPATVDAMVASADRRALLIEKGYSPHRPDRAGLWMFSQDGEAPEYVAVTGLFGKLAIHDEHLGRTDLVHFHENMIFPLWKRVS